MAKKAAKKITKKVSKKTSTAKLSVGDKAPDFTLPDQNGDKVSLKDYRGKNVLVYFYPKAMTSGCTVQACGLRDSKVKLHSQNIVVLGISADPVNKLKQFEEKQKLNFILLSDPEHEVTTAYGCWGLKKFMGREYMGIMRQSFLTDTNGKILQILEKVETKTHHQTVLELFSDR